MGSILRSQPIAFYPKCQRRLGRRTCFPAEP